MALLIPLDGGSFHRVVASSIAEFDVIGPIPEGRWIDLIYIVVYGQPDPLPTVAVFTGLSLGISQEPSRAGFEAGTSLVTRSDAVLFGKPALGHDFIGEGRDVLVLGVGRRIASGPSYIHVAMSGRPDMNTRWIVSARILGLAVETRERLGLPGEVVLP